MRDAINAHIGAGGTNVTFSSAIDGNAALLALCDAIDIAEGEEVVEPDVNDLVTAIAAENFAFEAATGEELTAEQKAVNEAFADTEMRVELDAAVCSRFAKALPLSVDIPPIQYQDPAYSLGYGFIYVVSACSKSGSVSRMFDGKTQRTER